MTDHEHDWACWLRAANAGDAAAYRRLLDALVPFLRRAVRFASAGVPLEDVEDVVQETLLAIHLKRHTWDDAAPVGPWVRAIARNKLIDSLRRRGRHVAVPIEAIIDTMPAATPAETLDPRDAERLLSVLNGRQQEVVRAISVDGATIRQVAERLRTSEGAVRVALHRGLAALARAYRSDME